ncbi:MAG: hypothetical protein GY866_25865 [Proteobacteria bacterium]|nr:hypothetical protein [Pseudomonadota bacterium]
MLSAGAVFGIFLVLFGSTNSLILAFFLLLFVGGGSSMFMTLTNSLIMENTLSEYVGRMMSIFVITFGLMPLWALPVGTLAKFFEAPSVVVADGSILLVMIVGVAFGRSDIRQLK